MTAGKTRAKKRIAVVTSSRADYGYLRPVIRKLLEVPEFEMNLIVTGMHLSPAFGSTVSNVEADGLSIAERVEMLLGGDSPSAVSKSIGIGIIGFAQAYTRLDPDLLLLMGDRYEMLAAGAAMLPFAKPMAHIAGGESTEGLIDEAIRHSLTKMSHVHYVSTEKYRDRVIQMGEEPWRVVVSGAPSLDNLSDFKPISDEELSRRIGLPLQPAPMIATFHPLTLEYTATRQQVEELLTAIHESGLPTIFTAPNADTNGSEILRAIETFVKSHPASSRLVVNLGTRDYFTLMQKALLMIGNSSSGIIEAASFSLPTINVGDRQRGRVHGENVLDVPCEHRAILSAIRTVSTPSFRHRIRGMPNPYGNGNASQIIVDSLRRLAPDNVLLLKKFYVQPVRPT